MENLIFHPRYRNFTVGIPEPKDTIPELAEPVAVDPLQVALILIDIWDAHPCKAMKKRTHQLAITVNNVVRVARKLGVRIIHSPSVCEDHYEKMNHPQRERFKYWCKEKKLKDDKKNKKVPWDDFRCKSRPDGFPKDLTNDDCDDQDRGGARWTHQDDAIKIEEPDVIVFEEESYRLLTFLKSHNIKFLVYAGTAIDQCVLWTRNTSIYYMNRLAKNQNVRKYSDPWE